MIIRTHWRPFLRLLRDSRGDMPVPEMFGDYPDVLTIENLQKALSIGRTTAYRLISSGSIKHWKIGKAIKIPKRYLLDYIKESCYTDGIATGLPSKGGKE